MTTSNQKTTGALTHLSALSQYFIPFGNFIFPIIIWSSAKKEGDIIDHSGKQCINFQLSLLLYSLILAMIAIPTFIYSVVGNIPFEAILNEENVEQYFNIDNITGILALGITIIFLFSVLKIAEFVLIIYASVKTANGEFYRYPFTINFLKTNNVQPELDLATEAKS
ncbi:DUF4870 domain-containing protein [Flavobacterium sp. NST-5]|uniref:DUF4870 domain-containing protein n=1 Tax=Flavobacterium ichthyis TaxID=2698827 RepID=A0ABW9Z7A4_9FLAO|nr:DUF4870 domain-containing protein [Flavobacterium ichthyis]NBL64554.1 DUF4870 domain-containing protein [Flavobacterium ichthyis]